MSEENKKIVGYVHSGYPEKRNIFSLKPADFVFRKQRLHPFKVVDYLYFKLFKRTNSFYHNYYLGFGNYNLMHFFNGLSLVKSPWVTTFETHLPRLVNRGKLELIGVKALSSSNCKQLIALSFNAKNIQQDYLKTHYPNFENEIMSKIQVVHPSQEINITGYTEKRLGDSLTFTFVGSLFFLKGGMEILTVFDELFSNKKYNLKLNIISDLNYRDHVSGAMPKDVIDAIKIIDKYPENINYFNYLPNNKVIDLLKNSHLALLPTYADTYGYFVLEAQSCGCPVITTDIRALSEINNNEVGYIISVPKNELGYGIISNQIERVKFSAILKENLLSIISHIYKNPEEIAIKGKACLNRISEYHNPEYNALLLNEIYLNAIK